MGKGYTSRQTATGKRVPSIRVHKVPAMSDYWGRAFPRPLGSNALLQAIRGYLARPAGALIGSLGKLHQNNYGFEDLRTVTAGLFQEGEYAYVFRINVEAEDRMKSRLAMIVAKNEGGMSRLAKLEHDNLKRLHERCKDNVVRPLQGGLMTVLGPRPARVYAYFTVWLNRFHELGVHHKNMNFYVNELPFQYFDSRMSDRIKGQMLGLMFRLYDPLLREAVEPPKVGAGDFVITRKSPHELKIIACRKILKGVSLDRCMTLYLGYQGTWGDRLFHFVPNEIKPLRQALIEGLVIHHGLRAEDVLLALKHYRDSLARIKSRQDEWTPLAALNKLLSEPW
jgi:hypothetical protein